MEDFVLEQSVVSASSDGCPVATLPTTETGANLVIDEATGVVIDAASGIDAADAILDGDELLVDEPVSVKSTEITNVDGIDGNVATVDISASGVSEETMEAIEEAVEDELRIGNEVAHFQEGVDDDAPGNTEREILEGADIDGELDSEDLI